MQVLKDQLSDDLVCDKTHILPLKSRIHIKKNYELLITAALCTFESIDRNTDEKKENTIS